MRRVIHLGKGPDDSGFLSVVLKQAGFARPPERVSSRDQLEARMSAGECDLVLCDFHLPDRGALRALETARALDPGVPFILSAEAVRVEDAVEAMAAGVDGLILSADPERAGASVRRAVLRGRQRRLRRREDDLLRLRAAALDAAPSPVIITDKSGVIVWVNPAFARVTGYSPEEAVGRTPRILKSGKQGGEFYRALWSTVLSGGTWRGELINRRRNGELYDESMAISPINADGGISHFVAVKEDATARRRSAEALRRANRAYRTLSECNQALVRASDERALLCELCRIMIDVGGYAMVWIGAPADDGREPVRLLAHAGRPDGVVDPRALSGAEGGCGRGLAAEVIRTGRARVARASSDPDFAAWCRGAAGGRLESMAALPLTFRDRVFGCLSIYAEEPDAFDEQELVLMTELAEDLAFGVASLRGDAERKSALEALRQSEAQLRQAQKMEAIGRLAGGVAHDFNNVLTAILGYCNFLWAELPAGGKSREDVGEVIVAAQRAAALTRQLLAFSRRQVLAPRVLDLNHIIEAVDKMLRRVIGEDVELVLRLDPGLMRARVDPGQVEQVILNLAVNGRDAMEQGGKLVIETANATFDEGSPGRHDVIAPGSYVMLAVSDTGAGMDEETKARLFEPFFTTKEKGKGTGLGLSTVYGIVKQSGGYIWVYSEPGRGSVFKVYLPATGETAERVAEQPVTPAPVRGSESVLLVEDDASVRQVLARGLRSNGYTVVEAAGASEALEAYRRRGGEISLVVTDMVMPGGGGKALGDSLKALSSGLKVVYMSGYTDEAILRRGELGPGTVFLQKPVPLKDFLVAVRRALDAPAARS